MLTSESPKRPFQMAALVSLAIQRPVKIHDMTFGHPIVTDKLPEMTVWDGMG
jgi:hypothetical protein